MTMSAVKINRRTTPKEQEAKQVVKCLRGRLAWCSQSNVKYDCIVKSSIQFYLELLLMKIKILIIGNWTNKLQSHYRSTEPPVSYYMIPWLPQLVIIIIDAMFLINA